MIDVESVESPGLVLIVEADAAVVKLVATVLKIWSGTRVVAASNGDRGMALARELKPDLVILGIRLPQHSGYDVARQLRADPATRSIPLVALTSDPRDVVLAAGFDNRVGKPFGVRQLVETVNAYLNPAADGRADAEASRHSGSSAPESSVPEFSPRTTADLPG